ncbi:MAG: hypothetical protein IPI48_16810 [bacterium]|nr:hypothetical protein [bacterium]
MDSHANPFGGNAAWCGTLAFAACSSDLDAGGYGNDWYDILEFRKAVPGAAIVRVQADLQFDTEPGYDHVRLQRRTQLDQAFEPIVGGQGQEWDGAGITTVDYTFSHLGRRTFERHRNRRGFHLRLRCGPVRRGLPVAHGRRGARGQRASDGQREGKGRFRGRANRGPTGRPST